MKEYKHFGVMLDCSRNAVMRPSEVKRFIDCLEKMGYNTLELYAEDTYQVKGEPYFGYLRGAYTAEELKDIDSYAAEHGIELIPCIQTLAHFTNPVKLPAYAEIVDTADILLIDDEKTYELLEKIIASAAENFTSRNIHIGMDEAHMVGLGRYLDKHGYCNRFEILVRHLERVAKIAGKYGFKAHMWSDMFFRLQNHGVYYARDLHIDEKVRALVPENVELVYWDYYHTDVADYDAMFVSHKEFNKEVWFAGGAWCWNGFAPFNLYTQKSMRAAMESVLKNGTEHILITMWGDNGKECSFFSLLPSLYAIRQYAEGEFDEGAIARGFEEKFGLSWNDFMLLDSPNYTKKTLSGEFVENACKSLLFNDCFMGILDKAAEKEGKLPYAEYAEKLSKAVERAGEYGYVFRCLASLCEVLDIKAELGIRTRNAYRRGDKKALLALAEEEYSVLLNRLKTFYKLFKALWFKENKPFGWEIQEARLGGLMLRIESCKERLAEYAAGKTERIEELEADILPYGNYGLQANLYRGLVSTSEL